MSAISRNKKTKTETGSVLRKTVKPHILKTEPNEPSLYSQMSHRLLVSKLLGSQSNLPRPFQQPHCIKIALSRNLKQPQKKIVSTHRRTQTEDSPLSKYELSDPICEGSSSTVFVGHTQDNRKFAVKRVRHHSNRPNKQLNLLRCLNHPNILKFEDYYKASNKDQLFLHIVTELFPSTLQIILRKRSINRKEVPLYLFQLLKGLEYLKQKHIMHRDLTPSNIFIDISKQRLVIGDFGSAKISHYSESSVSYVGSRRYRAPELLFGSVCYDSSVDMWSFGCIMVEMLTGVPAFQSKSSTEHILQIMKKLGTPTESQINFMNSSYSARQYELLPKIKKKAWKDIINTRDHQALDLIEKLLVYQPGKRLKPAQALKHPFFEGIQQQDIGDTPFKKLQQSELYNEDGDVELCPEQFPKQVLQLKRKVSRSDTSTKAQSALGSRVKTRTRLLAA